MNPHDRILPAYQTTLATSHSTSVFMYFYLNKLTYRGKHRIRDVVNAANYTRDCGEDPRSFRCTDVTCI